MRRIIVLIKIFALKFKYRKKINISYKVSFRKGLNININGGKLIIGDGVFINNNCSINCQKLIKIGDNTLIGENVKIYDHNHRYKDKKIKIREQGFNTKEVSIGENCWIGSNVTILKGVEIGNNVVIGANVLVHKSIPDDSIVRLNTNIIVDKY